MVEPDVQALIGLPFDHSDEVIRTAVEQASVPALLMSMVHMTGDLGLLDELPGPYLLFAMDLQGGMSEPDKQTVRDRAFDVIRDYRDRGCPPPLRPEGGQLRRMLDVMSAETVTDDHVEYVSADLRFTDRDQTGPVLASTPAARGEFPVLVIGCGGVGDAAIAESMPRLEGNQMHTILSRKPSGGGKGRPAAPKAPAAVAAAPDQQQS